MEEYTFKEEYYTADNIPVVRSGFNRVYCSPVVSGGNGTKSNPFNPYNRTLSAGEAGMPSGLAYIFADGYYKIQLLRNNTKAGSHFIGHDFRNCYLDGNIFLTTDWTIIQFKDLRLSITISQSKNMERLLFSRCVIEGLRINGYVDRIQMNGCIIRTTDAHTGSSNSYVDVDGKAITNNNLSLVENSNVIIKQDTLTSYADLYYAFNDCKFKIGTETDYTGLSGDTQAELRADFVARCTAQGITPPAKTEYGETLPMCRWVFAKNSSHDGAVLPNSMIHNFEKRRYVYFGYTSCREGISVNSAVNVPNSISIDNPNQNIEIADNAAKLPANSDVSAKITSKVQSNICWLGGLKQLTNADVIHNFDMKYGLAVDTSPNIESTPTLSGDLEPGSYYLVRSKDKNVARLNYNGVNYSSSLAERKNIFLGVDGQAEFSGSDLNAVVYKLTGQVQYRHIDMRIVNKIPDEIIRDGNLDSGCWYLVEHDSDQSNTTDYITYKGVNYPPLSSFLADESDLTFTLSGDIHLRRCWADDFFFDKSRTENVWTYYYDDARYIGKGCYIFDSSGNPVWRNADPDERLFTIEFPINATEETPCKLRAQRNYKYLLIIKIKGGLDQYVEQTVTHGIEDTFFTVPPNTESVIVSVREDFLPQKVTTLEVKKYTDEYTTPFDKDFWMNEQKPKWFKVVGSDLRCLMKRNVKTENEMQTDENGDYITSGHPLFYKNIVGDNGILMPSYPIKGAYMQMRLVISTLNPM